MNENTTPTTPDKLDQILEKLDRIERQLQQPERDVTVSIEKLVDSLNVYTRTIYATHAPTTEQVTRLLRDAVQQAEAIV